jgi:hypothetical protein
MKWKYLDSGFGSESLINGRVAALPFYMKMSLLVTAMSQSPQQKNASKTSDASNVSDKYSAPKNVRYCIPNELQLRITAYPNILNLLDIITISQLNSFGEMALLTELNK